MVFNKVVTDAERVQDATAFYTYDDVVFLIDNKTPLVQQCFWSNWWNGKVVHVGIRMG